MQAKLWFTNGDLGTDNQFIMHYAIHTPQGMARVRHWANYLADKTGKAVQVLTWEMERLVYETACSLCGRSGHHHRQAWEQDGEAVLCCHKCGDAHHDKALVVGRRAY